MSYIILKASGYTYKYIYSIINKACCDKGFSGAHCEPAFNQTWSEIKQKVKRKLNSDC